MILEADETYTVYVFEHSELPAGSYRLTYIGIRIDDIFGKWLFCFQDSFGKDFFFDRERDYFYFGY